MMCQYDVACFVRRSKENDLVQRELYQFINNVLAHLHMSNFIGHYCVRIETPLALFLIGQTNLL